MPKIEIKKNDLYKLLKKKLNNIELETLLESAKAELDDITGDLIKIELNDTNRPDQWTSAGIARHINQYLKLNKYDYPFFKDKAKYIINVDKNIQQIRPYIAGFAAKNIKINEDLLLELIQNQEKFAMNFGRKRADIAIGIYKLNRIKFPIIYKAVKPESIKFTPLEEKKEMNLNEILKNHPKGVEFKHIVKDHKDYPIILDSDNNVLSFPPIINSKYIGEVEVGDNELFVELTGSNITNILLVANIIACDLSDRGAEIIPIQVNYPYETKYTKSISVPYDFKNKINIKINKFDKIIGSVPKKEEITANLKTMGYNEIKIEKDKLSIKIPPYRNDIMHLNDIAEDYIIGKGYNNFNIKMPSNPTIGVLSKEELFSDKLRTWAVGMEFQEILSNILTSEDNIYNKMNIEERGALEIANPMTESFNVIRNSIIPLLLEVEAVSAKADYPHKIFEIGEVAEKDSNENHGFKTELNIGFLSAHSKTNFSEMRSYVDNIIYYAGIDDFQIKPIKIPYLLKGRSAQIIYKDKILGYFGEIHPEVLEKWDINMPCSIIEIYVNELMLC